MLAAEHSEKSDDNSINTETNGKNGRVVRIVVLLVVIVIIVIMPLIIIDILTIAMELKEGQDRGPGVRGLKLLAAGFWPPCWMLPTALAPVGEVPADLGWHISPRISPSTLS